MSMSDVRRRPLAPLLLSATLACSVAPSTSPEPVPTSPATTDVEELAAFTALYGAVRFFHPSDAAASADWDALAIAGARDVVLGNDRAALHAALKRWLDPIAPTVQVYVEGQPPPELYLRGEGPIVAWQHHGFGGDQASLIYQSVRIGRSRTIVAEGGPFGSILAKLDAKPLAGKRVRLQARLRIEGEVFGGLAVFAGESSEAELLGFTPEQPSQPNEWGTRSIEVTVPKNQVTLAIGGIVEGEGSVQFDDFTLTVIDRRGERLLPLSNPGFEQLTEGWDLGPPNYEVTIIEEAGNRLAQIQTKLEQTDAPIFAAKPAPGETVDLELGAGLRVRLPVALPDSLAARPPSDSVTAAESPVDSSDPAVRAAAVVVGWSVLRHFYPYTIDEDWNAVLVETLADALDDQNSGDVRETLERMLAKLDDGHGSVHGSPDLGLPERGYAQLELARVEGKIIVVAKPEGSKLELGDELVGIDGTPISEAFAEASTRISGSPQWLDVRLLRYAWITEGPPGKPVRLQLLRHDQSITVELARVTNAFEAAPARPAIERLDDGSFYVDLSRAEWQEIQAQLPELAAAPGVVFDLRGYPKGNNGDILQHLVSEPSATESFFVPQLIYPNQDRVAGWSGRPRSLIPAAPRISGRVAFVTDARAISQAEELLSLVQGLELAEIVGSPTAGANGTINPFEVPGGFRLIFTGAKVTLLDGGQHHGIGVIPTILVEPSIAGIIAGRDELLERALALVRAK
jgi:C-terminal processing protease CtpA/Prc